MSGDRGAPGEAPVSFTTDRSEPCGRVRVVGAFATRPGCMACMGWHARCRTWREWHASVSECVVLYSGIKGIANSEKLRELGSTKEKIRLSLPSNVFVLTRVIALLFPPVIA